MKRAETRVRPTAANLLAGLLVCLAGIVAGPASARPLAEDGRSEFVIVLPDDAIPAEETAAQELRDHLEAMTGAALPIARESAPLAKSAKARVLVGSSAAAKSLIESVDWGSLRRDEIVLKRPDADTLVLAGQRPRGSLYAVYTLLEDELGVRWWTDEATFVPRRETLALPDVDTRYAPPFWYRSAYYWQTRRLGESAEAADLERKRVFAARLRLNGHHSQLDEKRGGAHAFAAPPRGNAFVHTFYYLVPPEKHYAAHPDWFSGEKEKLENARGHVNGGQLCLTNPDVLETAKASALAWLEASPGADLISISQNDGTGGYCECERCRALAKKEGSQSGPILHFVNAIAAEIEKVRPDVVVETLAYNYSVKPPKHVRPRANVMIRLCSYHTAGARPLDHEMNAVFRDQAREWARIAPRLFAWNYYTNFPDQYLPHPNHPVFAPDLRFLRNNKVEGLFQQASMKTAIGDFSKMKLWLQAHLLWNPDRDTDALIDEFLKGYYGPAAPHLRDYLDMAYRSVRDSGVAMPCNNDDLTFIDHAFLSEGERAFDAAEKAVAGDAERLLRVRRARVCLDYAQFVRAPVVYERRALLTGKTQRPRGNLQERFEALTARLPEYDESGYCKSDKCRSNFEMCRNFMRPEWKPATRPEGIDGEPFEDWFDVQEAMFHFHQFGRRSFIEKDEAASNGYAGWIHGDKPHWAIQFRFPAEAVAFASKARCRIAVRRRSKEGRGAKFRAGIYDVPHREGVVATAFDEPDVPADAYRLYDLGVHDIRAGRYIWIAGEEGSGIERIYVDRIILTPAD